MPLVQLRKKAGVSDASDVAVNVQDKTFSYLHTSQIPNFQISAYFEKDYDQVEAMYEEVYVSPECEFESKITRILPGSRKRKGLKLPCSMKAGEQLTLQLERKYIK